MPRHNNFVQPSLRDGSDTITLNPKQSANHGYTAGNCEGFRADQHSLGSLRLPDDPTWPKIPQRKMHNDLSEIINPPCVVTLSETMRRSRTSVGPPSHDECRGTIRSSPMCHVSSPNYRQSNSTMPHLPQRRPGCTDSRFKVTSIKSSITSSSSMNPSKPGQTEMSRSAIVIPTNCEQNQPVTIKTNSEATTPPIGGANSDKSYEVKSESIAIQTMTGKENKSPDAPVENTGPSAEETQLIKQIQGPNEPPIANTEPMPSAIVSSSILSGKSDVLSYYQGTSGVCFSPMPVNPLTVTQCYNVQVPTFSYQNMPVHTATTQGKLDGPGETIAHIPPISTDEPKSTDDGKLHPSKATGSQSDMCVNKIKMAATHVGVQNSNNEELIQKEYDDDAGNDTVCSTSDCDMDSKYDGDKMTDNTSMKELFKPRLHTCCNSNRKMKFEGNILNADRKETHTEVNLNSTGRQPASGVAQPLTPKIPMETQQRLNKSYWDYYTKLRTHQPRSVGSTEGYFGQIQMGAPELKKRKAEDAPSLEKSNGLSPLEQCTVLSSMINQSIPLSSSPYTKELFMNCKRKSFSDPAVATESGNIQKILAGRSADEESTASSKFIAKIRRKYRKPDEKKLLNLRTVVLFLSLIYLILILGQPLYDYCFDDDFESYEDVSWIDFMFNYVVASFSEAYSEIVGVVLGVLRRPNRCNKCDDI